MTDENLKNSTTLTTTELTPDIINPFADRIYLFASQGSLQTIVIKIESNVKEGKAPPRNRRSQPNCSFGKWQKCFLIIEHCDFTALDLIIQTILVKPNAKVTIVAKRGQRCRRVLADPFVRSPRKYILETALGNVNIFNFASEMGGRTLLNSFLFGESRNMMYTMAGLTVPVEMECANQTVRDYSYDKYNYSVAHRVEVNQLSDKSVKMRSTLVAIAKDCTAYSYDRTIQASQTQPTTRQKKNILSVSTRFCREGRFLFETDEIISMIFPSQMKLPQLRELLSSEVSAISRTRGERGVQPDCIVVLLE
ncbi:hypothetical protein WN51_09320 [Melipona quadrifasciata]|uniref:Uncharacterized protein n=1 Tax=Melipona quadrifasciata TaxID=166423 RepID=A0A0M9A5I1_9HYME|nr:hypothetical protein WN51_09320 [Melipona quadrifasciata]